MQPKRKTVKYRYMKKSKRLLIVAAMAVATVFTTVSCDKSGVKVSEKEIIAMQERYDSIMEQYAKVKADNQEFDGQMAKKDSTIKVQAAEIRDLLAQLRKAKSGQQSNVSCKLSVPVTNTGKREGTETVQVYVKRLDDAGAPIKALKGFQKLSLKPGETKTATITLDGEAFEYYDETIDELAVKPGRYKILYGTSSLDKDLQALDFVVK